MKTLTLIISFALISTITMATSAKFQMAMGKNLGKYAQCKTIEDYQTLANNFEVLAKAEPQEWLPLYYQAHCYILISFNIEGIDLKDPLLDKAELLINKMIEMKPNESEIYALQGFFYTARLVIDPQTRGQQYSMLSNQALSKALSLNSNNPRAKYMLIQNELGTAQFFNSDTAPIYAKANEVFKQWDNYTPKSKIHPNWGKDQLEQLLASEK